jgi:hypothetical protein
MGVLGQILQLTIGGYHKIYMWLDHSGYHYHFIVGVLIMIQPFKKIQFWAIHLLGLGKEIYDSLGYGSVDFFDFIFTILPYWLIKIWEVIKRRS